MRRPAPAAASAVTLLLCAVLAGCTVDGPDQEDVSGDGAGTRAPVADRQWASGAAGTQVFDGSLADWRGSDVDVVGTWADTNDAMVALYELQPGGPLAGWEGDMDIAVGAIGPDESWAEAADGAYDARWAESLQALSALREGLGTTYVRFAHESNGDWYDWSVDAGSAEDFVRAWRRYRELQLEHMPEAELVFSVNSESVGTGLDWRETFPGAEHVDLLGVDHYNQYPWVNTVEDWDEAVLAEDEWGAPRGLERHAEFAAEVGLPFSVNEWSNNADMGDAPVYLEQMHDFFTRYAGDGPGELVYEVHFNVQEFGDGQFALYPDTRMPDSADVYRQLW